VGFEPTILAGERTQTYDIIELIPVIIIIIIIIIMSTTPGNHEVKELQKTAILGNAHILRKVLM
jgi:hypothetical protein